MIHYDSTKVLLLILSEAGFARFYPLPVHTLLSTQNGQFLLCLHSGTPYE